MLATILTQQNRDGPHVWDKLSLSGLFGLSGSSGFLVHRVGLVQPNKQDRPNEQVMLADCFRIRLAANKGDEFLVDEIRSFPLWDVPRVGDSDEL